MRPCYTFTLGGHSDHQTSESSSILKVLRCCPDPLTPGQLGLGRPEMTDRKLAAPVPRLTQPTQRKPLGTRLALASSGQLQLGILAGHKPGQAIPWNPRNHSPPLPTIRPLQSWRLVTAARGASTGTSGAAPRTPAGSGQREHTLGARLLWPAGLAPAATSDSPGPSRWSAPTPPSPSLKDRPREGMWEAGPLKV